MHDRGPDVLGVGLCRRGRDEVEEAREEVAGDGVVGGGGREEEEGAETVGRDGGDAEVGETVEHLR